MTDFDAFWAAYPLKEGRLAAESAYFKARKRVTADKLLEGVARYVAHKPDWKEWCSPSRFLKEGRWMDEYDVPVTKPVARDWLDECKEMHDGTCEGSLRHVHRVKMDAFKAQAS